MKKVKIIFITAIALITFALNISMDSEGNYSWLAETSAEPPVAVKWKRNLYTCYDPLRNVMGYAYGCDEGSDANCTPDPPCKYGWGE